jgi:hypothetical protein
MRLVVGVEALTGAETSKHVETMAGAVTSTDVEISTSALTLVVVVISAAVAVAPTITASPSSASTTIVPSTTLVTCHLELTRASPCRLRFLASDSNFRDSHELDQGSKISNTSLSTGLVVQRPVQETYHIRPG